MDDRRDAPGGAPPTVLVGDDCPATVGAAAALLQPHARVLAASSGEQALVLLERSEVDLVLLDIGLEGIDGFETLSRIRANPRLVGTPVMLVTAAVASENEERCLALGAVDFLRKPLRPGVVLRRVLNQLEARRTQRELLAHNRLLASQAEEQRQAGRHIADISLLAIGYLAGTRDPETGSHLYRTQMYLEALCADLRRLPAFAATITGEYIETLTKSAPLHDIGKVGIPDHILLKPGPLTAQEWVVMRQHAAIGADALERAQRSGEDDGREYLSMARDIARHHHERWDGTGYPDALAGTAIPLAARLMAIADVYDALISRRPYKEPFPPAQAALIIIEGSGSHFDPAVVAAFVRQRAEFERIAADYADPPEAADVANAVDAADATSPHCRQLAA
jgi:putative two-component system response regulator